MGQERETERQKETETETERSRDGERKEYEVGSFPGCKPKGLGLSLIHI